MTSSCPRLVYIRVARIPRVRAAFILHALVCSLAFPVVLYAGSRVARPVGGLGVWASGAMGLVVFGASVAIALGFLVAAVARVSRAALAGGAVASENDVSTATGLAGELERVGQVSVQGLSSGYRWMGVFESHALLFLAMGFPVVFSRGDALVVCCAIAVVCASLLVQVLWYWLIPEWLRTVQVSPSGVLYHDVFGKKLYRWTDDALCIVEDDRSAYLLLGRGRRLMSCLWFTVPLSPEDTKRVHSAHAYAQHESGS